MATAAQPPSQSSPDAGHRSGLPWDTQIERFIQTERYTDRKIYRQRDTQIERYKDRKIYGQIYIQKDRYTDREIYR